MDRGQCCHGSFKQDDRKVETDWISVFLVWGQKEMSGATQGGREECGPSAQNSAVHGRLCARERAAGGF